MSYFNLGEPLTSFSSKAQISLFAKQLAIKGDGREYF